MNERDREQHGRHGVRHLGERLFGRRDESRDDDRDEGIRDNIRGEGRDERYARSLRDTYNPEPQWLQQDRESESGRGRGTGREWGESDRADQNTQGRTNRDFGARNYGQRDEQRMREERDYDQRSLGQRGQRTGYEASSWDDDELDFNTRRYEPFRVGTGMGLGPMGRTDLEFGQGYGRSSGYAVHQSGYGSRGGWDVGAHQRDWVGEQRHSYRGMGPQSYKRSDERIREDIFEHLTDSHIIDARSILVDVNQGNVTLSGTVSERRMRYAAEDLVERIGGVANINNQLRVQQGDASPPGSTPSDNERH